MTLKGGSSRWKTRPLCFVKRRPGTSDTGPPGLFFAVAGKCQYVINQTYDMIVAFGVLHVAEIPVGRCYVSSPPNPMNLPFLTTLNVGYAAARVLAHCSKRQPIG